MAKTARKHLATPSRESEDYRRQLLEVLPDAAALINPAGRLLAVNQQAVTTLGYENAQELLLKSAFDLVAPEQRELVLETFTQARRTGILRSGTFTLLRKDGRRVALELSAAQGPEPRGRRSGMVVLARDVTERKWAQEQIRLLAHAVDSAQELISITDPNDRFIFVNRAFLQAYGYEEEEVLGQSPAMLRPDGFDVGLGTLILEQTLAGGWSGELINQRKDGTRFPVSLCTSRITTPHGEVLGLIGVARDITERRRAERQRTAFLLLGRELSATSGAQEAAQIILKAADELFGWDAAYVHLHWPASDQIVPVLTFDTIKGQKVPVDVSTFTLDPTPLMREVMHHGARLIDRTTEGVPDGIMAPFGDTSRPSACMMYAPVHCGSEVVGLLSIQSYTPKAYAAEDLHLLQALADYCGGALQRIRGQEELQAAEARCRSIVENATEGIFQAAPDGFLREANPALQRLLGGAADSQCAPLKAGFFSLAEKGAVLLKRLQAEGAVRNFETALRRADGSPILVSINAHVVRDSEGNALRYEGTVQDITERRQAERRIQELLDILEETQDAILVRDLEGRIQFFNRGAERLFGWAANVVRGRNSLELFAENASAHQTAQQQVLKTGKWQGELRLRARNGRLVPVHSRWTLVMQGADQAPSVVEINTDLTQHKQALKSLREREQVSEHIIRTAIDGFWMVDRRGRIIEANEAYSRMMGYTREQLRSMSICELEIHEPTPDLVASHIRHIIKTGGDRFETQHRHQDGRAIDVEVSATSVKLRKHYIFAFIRDITERKRAESERRQLSQRIIEAQEAERHRVARELHDGVNQLLAAARMRLQRVEEIIASTSPASREILSRCGKLLRQALEENRRIAHNLRPAELDHLGFLEACRDLCRQFQSRTGLVVKCSLPRERPPLNPAAELNLFRIVQEALTNVEQHARARSVRVSICLGQAALTLRIADDGRGFNPATGAKPNRRGIGLLNLRERTASLAGTCEILSAPGQGTRIRVRVPLSGSC
jgi:PAS domain S-box-containing protein